MTNQQIKVGDKVKFDDGTMQFAKRLATGIVERISHATNKPNAAAWIKITSGPQRGRNRWVSLLDLSI